MRLGDFLTARVQDVGVGDRPKRPNKKHKARPCGGVKILYLDHVDPSIQRHHVGIDYACMTSLNKGIPILPFHLVQGDVYSQRK